jgi:release factor glutamine methyltransferase
MTAVAAAGSESLLREATEKLRQSGIASPRREARLLLGHALAIPGDRLATTNMLVAPARARHFKHLIVRRSRHEPLAYIIGVREFWSLDFHVAPGVLIPRPETETLIESALRHCDNRPARVLDLGTGSGCLLLAFLSERWNAVGVGVDRSGTALAVAAGNARALGLADRAVFQQSNWTEQVQGRFDVIFANPPYIASHDFGGLPADVAQFEPVEALDGGLDGLDAYREIAIALPEVVAPAARLFVEIGHGHGKQVPVIFEAQGFIHEGTVCDLAGIPRCVIMRVRETGR